MSKLLVKERDVVVPGENIVEGMDYLPSKGTYRDGDKIAASQLGLVRIDGKVIKVIPLSGIYVPKRGDTVIGKVIDILMSGWRIDLRGPYSAVLGLKEGSNSFIAKGADLTRFYDIGDYIVTKITNVTSQKLIDVTMRGPGLRKLGEGNIISVSPNKVPRIIGKQGSMISMIKKATGCKINVGQNGLIWILGEPEMEVITIKTIKKIEREAHQSGLTDKIREYLEKDMGCKIVEETHTEDQSFQKTEEGTKFSTRNQIAEEKPVEKGE